MEMQIQIQTTRSIGELQFVSLVIRRLDNFLQNIGNCCHLLAKSVGGRNGRPVVRSSLNSFVGIGDLGHTIKDIIFVVEEIAGSRLFKIRDRDLVNFVIGTINHVANNIVIPLESASFGANQLLLSIKVIDGLGPRGASGFDKELGIGGAASARRTVVERHGRSGAIGSGRSECLLNSHTEVIVVNGDGPRRRNRGGGLSNQTAAVVILDGVNQPNGASSAVREATKHIGLVGGGHDFLG